MIDKKAYFIDGSAYHYHNRVREHIFRRDADFTYRNLVRFAKWVSPLGGPEKFTVNSTKYNYAFSETKVVKSLLDSGYTLSSLYYAEAI